MQKVEIRGARRLLRVAHLKKVGAGIASHAQKMLLLEAKSGAENRVLLMGGCRGS